MRAKRFCVIDVTMLTSVLFLAGCNPQISNGKRALEAKLKDPDSVKYKDVTTYSEGVVCGQYNAKNELGGYVGFKQFITLKSNLVEGSEHANYMLLCNDSNKNKVEVEDFELGRQDLEVTNSTTSQKQTWSVSVDLWIEKGKKYQLWDAKEELAKIASNFLTKDSKGLSGWKDNRYDPDRNDATEAALKAELQKHLKDIDIKGMNLTAY